MADARQAYAYSNLNKSITYIMDKLSQIDDGKYVDLDFISSEDVARFCELIGFKDSWAGKTIDKITDHDTPREEKPAYGPAAVKTREAGPIINILKTMIKQNRFTSREGTPFDKTILNDFLPPRRFAGEKTLGHFWEFRYALAVELEHGRTRGTNVTNNHPLLTALIVMAHLAEDKIYYARLWAMETEGELTTAVLEGKKKDEIADIAEELVKAKAYLAKRLAEKAAEELDLPK
jgi:hypothetical protein